MVESPAVLRLLQHVLPNFNSKLIIEKETMFHKPGIFRLPRIYLKTWRAGAANCIAPSTNHALATKQTEVHANHAMNRKDDSFVNLLSAPSWPQFDALHAFIGSPSIPNQTMTSPPTPLVEVYQNCYRPRVLEKFIAKSLITPPRPQWPREQIVKQKFNHACKIKVPTTLTFIIVVNSHSFAWIFIVLFDF